MSGCRLDFCSLNLRGTVLSLTVYDVLGNAWEWVQDCFNWTYKGAPTNGSTWEEGDCSVRVMRGASWVSTSKYLRAAHRAGERSTFSLSLDALLLTTLERA